LTSQGTRHGRYVDGLAVIQLEGLGLMTMFEAIAWFTLGGLLALY
jgi:hypothetical protein